MKKEKTISFQEFMSLPRVKVLSDAHCVTGWSTIDNLWEGVSSKVIGELAGMLPESGFVMVHSIRVIRVRICLASKLKISDASTQA